MVLTLTGLVAAGKTSLYLSVSPGVFPFFVRYRLYASMDFTVSDKEILRRVYSFASLQDKL